MTDDRQPDPTPNAGPDCWELVMADMAARRLTGIQRYGTPLQPHNDRDALQDLTEELLDAIVYLRQLREEDWRGRALAAEAEAARLRGIVDGLAARAAAQSELLAKRAEKGVG